MKIAVYPGSFDPVTNGHLDVIKRAAKMFDKVIVAVLTNQSKNPVFTQEERVGMLKTVTSDLKNVEIDFFSGLLVEYCKSVNSKIIVKGLRAVSDFEYEFQMALTNKQMDEEIDTVFLTTTARYMYLSSSIVREVGQFGGCIDEFVPKCLVEKIQQKIKTKTKDL